MSENLSGLDRWIQGDNDPYFDDGGPYPASRSRRIEQQCHQCGKVYLVPTWVADRIVTEGCSECYHRKGTEMMKLSVTPEGRPGIYLPNKEGLKAFIKARGLTEIHNFSALGPMAIGANHNVESVLADIDAADRIAVFTYGANMGHSLALITRDRLECYDIGLIQETDLEVREAR